MNKDQAKGRIKEAGGKIEKKIGRATRDRKTESEGAAREASGKVQKSVGDIKHKAAKKLDS